MSLGIEPYTISCEYSPQEGLNTETRREVGEAVDMLRGTTPGPTRLIEAINYIIGLPDNSDSGQQAPQRYLFSAFGYARGFPGLSTQIDGLLYAEAEGARPSGAFSVLRMATWVRRDNWRPTGSQAETEKFLVETALRDVETPHYYPRGIPVSRDTRIIPLETSPDELSVGETFGYIQDRKAVGGLKVPSGLRLLLSGAVKLYHEGLSTTGER